MTVIEIAIENISSTLLVAHFHGASVLIEDFLRLLKRSFGMAIRMDVIMSVMSPMDSVAETPIKNIPRLPVELKNRFET